MIIEIIIIAILVLVLFALLIARILHQDRYNKANTKREQAYKNAQDEWIRQQKKDFFKF